MPIYQLNSRRNLMKKYCIHELFEEQVKKAPESIALICEDKNLTYEELNAQANQMANYLRRLGVGPNILTAVCIERSVEMIVTILGILKSGGYYLPLDPSYPLARLEYMISNSKPVVLLTKTKWAEKINTRLGKTKIIYIDIEREVINNQCSKNFPNHLSFENLAYLMYTSGSTGKPKGVMIEHKSLVNLCKATINAYSLTEKDRILQFAALSFDTSIEEIFPTLICGATLVLSTEKFFSSISSFVQECAKFFLTVVNLPTAFWHELTLQLEFQHLSFPNSIRLVIIGGESALPERVKMWGKLVSPKVLLVNSYGCTELTAISTIAFINPINDCQVVSIGYPISNVQTFILNRLLHPVKTGSIGELYISGDGLARSYYNQPRLNKKKFIKHPFCDQENARIYRTGDLARYRKDGSIEIIGRVDNQVKIRGFRIGLGEIENTIQKFPNIKNVVVVVTEYAKGDKKLIAYFTTKNGTTIDVNNLSSYLQRKLPEYMIPALYVYLGELPLSPNGKIDRQALPIPDIYNLGLSQSIVPARTELEAQITYFFEKVLKIKPIGVKDNFFDIGGDSLAAIELITYIEEFLNIELNIHTLIQNPTVEKIAVAIQDNKETKIELSSIVLLQKGLDKNKPLIFIHPASGEPFVYMNIVRYIKTEQPVYGIRSADPVLTRIEEMANRYVALIEEIQPEGPYMICGYSMGGYVALEMAKILLTQGETIRFLALIDTTLPIDYHKEECSNIYSESADIDAIYSEILRGFTNPFLSDQQKEDFAHMTFDEQTVYVLEQMKNTNRATPNAEISWLQELIHNVYRNENAIKYYKPTLYPGDMVLITVAENKESDAENYGWKKFISGNLIQYKIPGNHYSILHEPNVKRLGEILDSNL